MLEHGINCDVAILVGESQELVQAHSFILTYRSPELSDMLASQSHLSHKLLTIRDMRKDVLEQIIRYIYTDDAKLTTELALAIIPATGLLGPKALRTKCFRYLMSKLTTDSVCTILEYSHIYDDAEIYNNCLQFIHVYAKSVLTSDNFSDLCYKCVYDVTRSDYLLADECTVFDAFMMFADKLCTRKKLELNDVNRRKVLGNLVFNVRFAILNIEDFVARIYKRRVLQPYEKKDILEILHGKPGIKRSQYILEKRKTYNVKQYLTKGQNIHSFGKVNENTGTNSSMDISLS